MADGFLGRWARRKEAVRKGEELPPEPVVDVREPSPQPAPASGRGSLQGSMQGTAALAPSPQPGEGGGEGRPPEEAPPLPTLQDVEALTPASDFSRFARPEVAPDVRNAAMKKLFADPHFNVMDRLDTYIDDYSQPDPLPPEMLRQLASAHFLDLFDERKNARKREQEEQAAAAGNSPTVREVADDPAAETMAQSGTAARTEVAVPLADNHADPDLRLQQDDAPGPEGPGERA